jgi:spore coat protein U-like protein
MSILSKLLVAGVAAIAMAGAANAQATATADSKATVIAPLTITKTSDLDFGVFAPGSTPGNVMVGQFNDRTSTGGVTLVASTHSTAGFSIVGAPGYNYSVIAPVFSNLAGPGGAQLVMNLKASAWTGNSGSQTITAYGSVNVAANQAAGNYAGTVSVTTNYQ